MLCVIKNTMVLLGVLELKNNEALKSEYAKARNCACA